MRLFVLVLLMLFSVQDSYSQIPLLEKAANEGEVDAMVWLGRNYALGNPNLNIRKNLIKAKKFLCSAANQGNAEAMFLLATEVIVNMEDFSEKEYESLLKRSACSGYGPAQAFYGDFCRFKGLYDEAYKYYCMGVQKGEKNACIGLGNCYRLGEGTSRDFEKAKQMYRKAYDQGGDFPITKYGLGASLLLTGQLDDGISLLQEAYGNGVLDAGYMIAWLMVKTKYPQALDLVDEIIDKFKRNEGDLIDEENRPEHFLLKILDSLIPQHYSLTLFISA